MYIKNVCWCNVARIFFLLFTDISLCSIKFPYPDFDLLPISDRFSGSVNIEINNEKKKIILLLSLLQWFDFKIDHQLWSNFVNAAISSNETKNWKVKDINTAIYQLCKCYTWHISEIRKYNLKHWNTYTKGRNIWTYHLFS